MQRGALHGVPDELASTSRTGPWPYRAVPGLPPTRVLALAFPPAGVCAPRSGICSGRQQGRPRDWQRRCFGHSRAADGRADGLAGAARRPCAPPARRLCGGGGAGLCTRLLPPSASGRLSASFSRVWGPPGTGKGGGIGLASRSESCMMGCRACHQLCNRGGGFSAPQPYDLGSAIRRAFDGEASRLAPPAACLGNSSSSFAVRVPLRALAALGLGPIPPCPRCIFRQAFAVFVLQMARQHLQAGVAGPGHFPLLVLHAQLDVPPGPRQGAKDVSAQGRKASRLPWKGLIHLMHPFIITYCTILC